MLPKVEENRAYSYQNDNKKIPQITHIHFNKLDEMDQFLEKHKLPQLFNMK